MHNFSKYLSPSALDEKWGFFINTVGYARTDPRQQYASGAEHPSTHSFTWNKGRMLDGYYVVFITKGSGLFESSLTAATSVQAGTCFLLFPGVWHRYKPDPRQGWEEYWVGFRGYYPEQLMKQPFFDRKNPFVNTGLHEELQSLFHRLINEVKSSSAGYHQIISGITLQILGLLNSISLQDDHERDGSDSFIARVRFRMRESIDEPVEMEELLREIPMSYSKFRQLFKQKTGRSPHQYYLDLRLDKARELLRSTTLTIDAIAWATGFDSIHYFSALFKKKTGMSPSDYRGLKSRTT
ncbi:MAG: helix-turn-helix domain-containing protein [Bacteroidetes bacterium]|nr:helix-turn-helix domain-containing protein [Bacteroidota bacterium]